MTAVLFLGQFRVSGGPLIDIPNAENGVRVSCTVAFVVIRVYPGRVREIQTDVPPSKLRLSICRVITYSVVTRRVNNNTVLRFNYRLVAIALRASVLTGPA